MHPFKGLLSLPMLQNNFPLLRVFRDIIVPEHHRSLTKLTKTINPAQRNMKCAPSSQGRIMSRRKLRRLAKRRAGRKSRHPVLLRAQRLKQSTILHGGGRRKAPRVPHQSSTGPLNQKESIRNGGTAHYLGGHNLTNTTHSQPPLPQPPATQTHPQQRTHAKLAKGKDFRTRPP